MEEGWALSACVQVVDCQCRLGRHVSRYSGELQYGALMMHGMLLHVAGLNAASLYNGQGIEVAEQEDI